MLETYSVPRRDVMCTHCKSNNVSRIQEYENFELWFCSFCKKTFIVFLERKAEWAATEIKGGG